MTTRPATVRLSAAGFSNWIGVNRLSDSFGVGFGVQLSSGANLTYSVQHTFDDIYTPTNCPLSRSTTVLTITKTNHGLSTDDWVQIDGTIWEGQYAIAGITDANNFTVTVANSGVTSGQADVHTGRVVDHADVDGETADADGNYQFPPRAMRLIITSFTGGFADLTVIQAGK